jgi:outer membrane protein OmpA-like peptidoglycan-associated protein
MKALSITAVAVFVAALFVAQTAQAHRCEYHQWKPVPCETKAVPAPVIKKGEQIVLEGVYFDSGSAKLKPASFGVLDANVAKILNSRKNLTIWVVGYTDDRGAEDMNQRLSERRADSVRNYFVSRGIATSRIKAIGRGESDPIADNSTASGRAQNRRIELEAK